MESLIGFLKFEQFISLDVLMIFYYLGVLFVPLMTVWFAYWLMCKSNVNGHWAQWVRQGGLALWSQLSGRQKLYFVLVFTLSFLLMQLFWRMLFEFLIAYMQIHAALTS